MKPLIQAIAVLLSPYLLRGTTKPSVVDFPQTIDGGAWASGHIQGIAVDLKSEVVYYSFTSMLVKTDFDGTVLGTVTGITGHLGDLAFNEKDGRVYASLEYKAADSFYIAIFDGDRINKMDLDAETDGIVTTVYLEEVARDFTADTPRHRYGSSGIDGVSFGPAFGRRNGSQMLSVAYGIYSDTERRDNDHQVILQYDATHWWKYEQPLVQSNPHTSGTAGEDGKYFVYTGNTTYGVQNLKYDPHTGHWLLGVYKGKKQHFPNYSLFAIDGSATPRRGVIEGQQTTEEGLLLPLLQQGRRHEATDIRGWNFTADVGLESLGNGYFYIATQGRVLKDGGMRQTAVLDLFRWTGAASSPFELVSR
ncbi:hypothetical protein IWX75_001490 [Arthrobacter sp. CAN_A6]|uniref:hypothetical protein n=1 Tax=Arthrobacter sp. CAN_A6 TaxID=2787721 RepID=UPI0018CA8F61